MTKMKIKLVCLFVALAATLTFTTVQAQFDDPDPPPPNTNIPFDGGLSLIIAAGVAYAAKKGYDKKNNQKQNGEVEK
jgi:hypothetical protein